MPRTEDGEFELVLGNKQLLSVFFIVVVLLGVFFTLGYVLGRNSSPIADDTARRESPVAAVTRPPGPSAMGNPALQPQDQPAQPDAESPATTHPEPQQSQSVPLKQEKPLEVPAITPSVTMPQAGATYVQVLAVPKPEAEVLVEVLGKKGLRAIIAPGPNDRLFRVLVGPVTDEEVPNVRTSLAEAGFKGAFPRKY